MGFNPGDIQPLKQPAKFTCRYLYGTLLTHSRPPESLLFQSPIKEPETIVMPVEDFDFVTESIAENEKMAGEWIGFQNILYQYH